jgi:5-methylthioadenosine/S-adenosylhomocysteine deaminase
MDARAAASLTTAYEAENVSVQTVIVAGRVRKWKGRLLDVDLPNLRRQLENSRDYIFAAAKIPQNLFGNQ